MTFLDIPFSILYTFSSINEKKIPIVGTISNLLHIILNPLMKVQLFRFTWEQDTLMVLKTSNSNIVKEISIPSHKQQECAYRRTHLWSLRHLQVHPFSFITRVQYDVAFVTSSENIQSFMKQGRHSLDSVDELNIINTSTIMTDTSNRHQRSCLPWGKLGKTMSLSLSLQFSK